MGPKGEAVSEAKRIKRGVEWPYIVALNHQLWDWIRLNWELEFKEFHSKKNIDTYAEIRNSPKTSLKFCDTLAERIETDVKKKLVQITNAPKK